ITTYMEVDAPSAIGQYTVDFNASLLNLRISDRATAPLNVDSTTYNIITSPTVKYYQERLRPDFWNGPRSYVNDPAKLNALDVTNIKITSVDERSPETGKPSKVSISFDAANKEFDIHHIVQLKIGSDTYTLGTVIYGDDPKRIEAHNIPVVNDRVSFTIIYRKWTFGNWFAEVGTKSAKAIITPILSIVAPQYSAIWFATGDIVTQLAKYTVLYAGQIWMEEENGYMTVRDATRILESSGAEQSDFLQFLTTAVGVTYNPFGAYFATVDFLRKSEKISLWNYARAYIAGFKHILANAETRLLDILVKAFAKAALKLGITLAAEEIVKQAFNEVLDAKLFLKNLGSFLDIVQVIGNVWSILWSPSEEGKEVSDAEIGADSAQEVDPVVLMSFAGQVDYTNDTGFGDTLNMNVSFNQTQAQAILCVDYNLTAVYLTLLSDSAFRSTMLSNLGFNATQTSLEWQGEHSTFILEATGAPYEGLLGLEFWMNSTYVQGMQIVSVDALQEGDTAWLNGSLLYPFGKNLTYTINTTFPEGSLIPQVLSDGNFTIHYNTVTWNTPIDQVAVQFIPPNVEIIEARPSKTIVGQNYNTTIEVEIVNHSFSTQSFNVTLYANETIIEQQTINLTNGTSTTVTFTWNTTGFVFGNYTVWAYAEPVEGETETADNTFVDGWVFVTISGDVDGDRDVDIFDIVRMASAYNSQEGDPKYDPNCDIDGDGDVDIFDIVAAAGNYNKNW
ncbi:MAG: CARDB domain-containing protein, partial [Candidatus Bathyarchaeia archaeon]